MKAREVVSKIESLGGYLIRQGKGSHRLYGANRDGVKAQTVVSMHSGDIPNGTLRAIERDMEPVFGEGWLR